jgi:hypothetical protein
MRSQQKGLSRVRAITEDEALADMTVRHGRRVGSPGVAWYRGHQAGVLDCVLTLKKKYPRIAEELRKAFGMKADGSYDL